MSVNFAEFCATLLGEIGGLPSLPIGPETRLYEDLGLDSLQVLLLLDTLDGLAADSSDGSAGPEAPLAIRTLGDAYSCYREQAAREPLAVAG